VFIIQPRIYVGRGMQEDQVSVLKYSTLLICSDYLL